MRGSVSIQGVRVTIPGAQTASHKVSAQVSLGLKPISDDDLNRAIASALAQVRFPNRRAIHLLPVSWSVDDQMSVRDPRGLNGRNLGLELLLQVGGLLLFKAHRFQFLLALLDGFSRDGSGRCCLGHAGYGSAGVEDCKREHAGYRSPPAFGNGDVAMSVVRRLHRFRLAPHAR